MIVSKSLFWVKSVKKSVSMRRNEDMTMPCHAINEMRLARNPKLVN
jgi:hypothetical protein